MKIKPTRNNSGMVGGDAIVIKTNFLFASFLECITSSLFISSQFRSKREGNSARKEQSSPLIIIMYLASVKSRRLWGSYIHYQVITELQNIVTVCDDVVSSLARPFRRRHGTYIGKRRGKCKRETVRWKGAKTVMSKNNVGKCAPRRS